MSFVIRLILGHLGGYSKFSLKFDQLEANNGVLVTPLLIFLPDSTL